MHMTLLCGDVRQVRKQKWDSYSKGEELFGLAVTKYPGLEKTEEEIQLLDRLYSCVTALVHSTADDLGCHFSCDSCLIQ